MHVINICYDKNYVLSDQTNIDIRNLDTIPNFSANHILISFLNRLEKQQSTKLIQALCNKLQNTGKLTISLLDFDQLISAYLNQTLKLDDIIVYTKNLECFIDKAEILAMFHKNSHFAIDSIKYDDIYTIYTISRTAI